MDMQFSTFNNRDSGLFRYGIRHSVRGNLLRPCVDVLPSITEIVENFQGPPPVSWGSLDTCHTCQSGFGYFGFRHGLLLDQDYSHQHDHRSGGYKLPEA